MKLRRRILHSLIGLAPWLLMPAAFCEHPNLTGSWQLDVASSSFGNMAVPDSGFMTISTGPHKMFHMEVVMKSAGQTGNVERSVDSDWKVDNKYHPVIGGDSGEVLAKWEGSVLTGKRQTATGLEEIRLVPAAGSELLRQSIQSAQGTRILIWRRR
jgi:hypothetical protein